MKYHWHPFTLVAAVALTVGAAGWSKPANSQQANPTAIVGSTPNNESVQLQVPPTTGVNDSYRKINTTATYPVANPESIEIFVPQPERPQPGTCQAFLQPAIQSIIKRPAFRGASWGILVETLDGNLVYHYNANRHFIPASNVKLLTTAAALQKLNPQSPMRSTTLGQWIKVTNVRSNNNYAEALLRHLGGSQSARQALTQLGVNPNGYRMADGSGLSRRNLATPRALVDTLRAMYYAPGKDTFYASLPVAGVSGTLRNRMRRTPAQGVVLAKTGTLRGVRALSGYLNNPRYGTLVFSILANQPGYSGQALVRGIDDIVLQLSTLTNCQ